MSRRPEPSSPSARREGRGRGRAGAALLAAAVGLLVAQTGPARADVPAPSCPGVTATGDVFKQVGPAGAFWLENIGFDGLGGMWVAELVQDKLVRFDAKGVPGVTLALPQPGASLIGPDGLMYAVYGVSPIGAVPGTAMAGVVRFDPRLATPVVKPFVSGLQMTNGAAFDAAGNLYVSDTTNAGVTKIRPDGTVDRAFATAAPVSGADGLVVSGGTLFATVFSDAQAPIVRIPLDRPAAYSTLTRLSPSDGGPGGPRLLDDAQLGPDGRLYVAAGSGQLVRVDRDTGASCVLFTAGRPIDSVRFADHFPPFDPASDLFLTSQDGAIVHVRLRSTTPAPAPAPGAATLTRVRLTVSPGRARLHRTVRLHIRARSARVSCRRGLRVRIGRRSARTDSHGRATITVRPRATGLRTVSARGRGCRTATARLRVVGARG